jgi:PKD repeat protein
LKTLNVIYVCRVAFGILAAVVAALVVDLKIGDPLINGITIALAVYLVTYYLLKWQFLNKVEKPTKIFTMGIGAYFLVFIMCWVLFITPSLAPPTAIFTVTPENPVVGETVEFNASDSFDTDGTDGKPVKYIWAFGDENTGTGESFTHSYGSAGEYIVMLTVVDDHGISSTNTTILTVVAPS